MPPKIKIITGPIGAGKTTALNRIKESYKRREIFVGQKVGFFDEPTDKTLSLHRKYLNRQRSDSLIEKLDQEKNLDRVRANNIGLSQDVAALNQVIEDYKQKGDDLTEEINSLKKEKVHINEEYEEMTKKYEETKILCNKARDACVPVFQWINKNRRYYLSEVLEKVDDDVLVDTRRNMNFGFEMMKVVNLIL
ncbi:hypothetical protein ACTFIV_006280 [Dictyostelium citrinum]